MERCEWLTSLRVHLRHAVSSHAVARLGGDALCYIGILGQRQVLATETV
jgi:hypothetical protein